MNIQKLKNPKSQSYLKIKNFIFSDTFPWYWNETSTPVDKLPEGQFLIDQKKYEDIKFYSHILLRRPEDTKNLIPAVKSQYLDDVAEVLLDILDYNNISINSFLRINVNCINCSNKSVKGYPHRDHSFDHKNMILYLSKVNGKIYVDDKCYEPKEDDAIYFNGSMHYLQMPKTTERRVCIVATFF